MANPWIGALEDVGLGRETTRGETTAADIWVPLVARGFDAKVDVINTGEAIGNIFDAHSGYVAKKRSEGSLNGEINDQEIGHFLYAALGTLSTQTDTPVTGANTHTFTIANNNNHPTYTIWRETPAHNFFFRNCMLESLTLRVEPGEIAQFESEWRGLGPNDTGSLSPSYTSASKKFLARHASVRLAAQRSGLGSASAVSLKSFEITITKNLVDNDVIGSLEAEDIHNQQMSIEGSFSLKYQNDTYVDYMLNGSRRAMRFKMTGDIPIVGTTMPDLQIDLPACRFYEWEKDTTNDAIATETINFRADYDMANSENPIYNAILINGKSSY